MNLRFILAGKQENFFEKWNVKPFYKLQLSHKSIFWKSSLILSLNIVFSAYTISEYIFIETTSLSLKEIFLGLPKYYIKVRVHLFMLRHSPEFIINYNIILKSTRSFKLLKVKVFSALPKVQYSTFHFKKLNKTFF